MSDMGVARELTIEQLALALVPHAHRGASFWDRGVPYLADDLDTVWGDEEGGPVKIVEQLVLAPHQRPPLAPRVDVRIR